jgi:hypothetical protein
MKRNHQEWLQTNRMLVMAGISLLVLTILNIAGISTISENANTLFTSLFSVVILAIAWLLDLAAAHRGSAVLPREMRTDIADLLEASEVPFIFRVGSSPNPLAEHADRFEALIKEAHHWDWTLYLKSPSASINEQIIQEIDRVYLSAPVETSTFGYIVGQWEFSYDYIVVGVVHSTEANQPFINRPWEISDTSTVNLLPVKVFEYSYVPKGEDWVVEGCKVYDTSPAVEDLLRRLLDRIDSLGKRKELWSVGTKRHWQQLPFDVIRKRIADEFAGPSTSVYFHRLLSPNLRTWLSNQPRGVFIIGVVGYMLSPFSIYNDMFVNIPLAFLLGYLLHFVVPATLEALVTISYIGTNLLGIAMMIWGFHRLRVRKQFGMTRGQVWLSTLYVALIPAIVWILRQVTGFHIHIPGVGSPMR